MRAPRIPLTPHERRETGSRFRMLCSQNMLPMTKAEVRNTALETLETVAGRSIIRMLKTDRRVVINYCVAYYELEHGGNYAV